RRDRFRSIRRPQSLQDLARRVDGRTAASEPGAAGRVRRKSEGKRQIRTYDHHNRYRIGRADAVCLVSENARAVRTIRFSCLPTPASLTRPSLVGGIFPKEINGKISDDYIHWIAPASLIPFPSPPAAGAPAGLTADRLPVGLQIVGPRFEEPKILGLAKLVQQ